MKTYTPILPLTLEDNQYGFPCKTYYHVVDAAGKIYHHSDKQYRKKSLREITTYIFRNVDQALDYFAQTLMNGRPRGVLIIPPKICLMQIEILSYENDVEWQKGSKGDYLIVKANSEKIVAWGKKYFEASKEEGKDENEARIYFNKYFKNRAILSDYNNEILKQI